MEKFDNDKNELDQVKDWLDQEIGRTMGRNLADFSEDDQNELIEIYCDDEHISIREAVRKWQLS